MRLIFTSTSPYARKVRIALSEKGLPFDAVQLAPSDPTVTSTNPLGKVPVLMRDDGSALYDSPVMVQYLEVIAPRPALYPADPLARIEVLRWEALGDGICDATVARMIENRRTSEKHDPGTVAHQEAKIARGLAAMERDLGDRPFAVGESFTLADIVVAMVVGYVDLRADALLEPHPALRARYGRLCERPSIGETTPPR